MPQTKNLHIAVCFFGITRSLKHTINSIEENIIFPAQARGTARIFAHFFDQKVIDNPRSGESGKLPTNEHLLLHPNWVEIEEPDLCLSEHCFAQVKSYGDAWNDDFRSLRNLIHQLHSLNRVTRAALDWQPDIFIFARPDLRYHDSLGRYINAKSNAPLVQLPSWQHWKHGLNDRFAIATGSEAAQAYGTRINLIKQFCHDQNRSLHAELLLRYALEVNSINTKLIGARASRVRSDSTQVDEDFSHYQVKRIARFPKTIRRGISRLIKQSVDK